MVFRKDLRGEALDVFRACQCRLERQGRLRWTVRFIDMKPRARAETGWFWTQRLSPRMVLDLDDMSWEAEMVSDPQDMTKGGMVGRR